MSPARREGLGGSVGCRSCSEHGEHGEHGSHGEQGDISVGGGQLVGCGHLVGRVGGDVGGCGSSISVHGEHNDGERSSSVGGHGVGERTRSWRRRTAHGDGEPCILGELCVLFGFASVFVCARSLCRTFGVLGIAARKARSCIQDSVKVVFAILESAMAAARYQAPSALRVALAAPSRQERVSPIGCGHICIPKLKRYIG